MPRGGKRVRSGPMPDPSSGASERRGYTLRSLPTTEYKGRPPKFPLPPYVLSYFDKDSQEWVEDRAGSESWNERESELWRQLWRLPQARAWKQPQLKYLHYQIASYVRECVVCESPSAKAADVAVKIRLEDRIGLSEAGLQALGWKIEAEAERKPVDSEFTRRRAKELNRESAAERSPMDETRHVYQRRMSGNG